MIFVEVLEVADEVLVVVREYEVEAVLELVHVQAEVLDVVHIIVDILNSYNLLLLDLEHLLQQLAQLLHPHSIRQEKTDLFPLVLEHEVPAHLNKIYYNINLILNVLPYPPLQSINTAKSENSLSLPNLLYLC